jgi:hypothetical protein
MLDPLGGGSGGGRQNGSKKVRFLRPMCVGLAHSFQILNLHFVVK